MSASKTSTRGFFHPDEINEMRDELARGDIPGETLAERESRAHEIFERKTCKVEPDPALEEANAPLSSA